MTKNKLLLLLVLLTMLSTRAVAQNDASAMREQMKTRIDELTILAPENVKGLIQTLKNDVKVFTAQYTEWYNASKSYEEYDEAYGHLGFLIDRVNKYLAAYGEFTDNIAKLKTLIQNFNADTEKKQGYETFAQNVYDAYKALSEHDMIALDDDDVEAQKEYDDNEHGYVPDDVTSENIADVHYDPSEYISTYDQFNAFFSQNNKELGSIYLEVAGTGTAESPEDLTAQLRNPNLENAGEQWWGTDWTAFGNSAAEQSGKPFITYQQVHLPPGYYTLVGYGMDRRGSWADVLANDEDWNEDHRTYLFSHLDSDGVDSTIVDAFKAKNMALTADITNGAGNISTCKVDGVTYYTPNDMAQYRAWEDAKIAMTGNGHGALVQFWVWDDEGDFGTLGFAHRWPIDNTWFVADGIQLYYAKDNFPDINIDTPITPAATGYSVTMAEGTEEADKWTVKVGEGEAQAFPVEGLDGGETVTVTYSGEKKVKSVKAVKKAPAVSFTEVTTFNELQTELSAGKNVKLMNDIECTEGIEITSNGVTIDGNGKKLTLNMGISLASGATLTIQGNGTMVVNGTNNSKASTVAGSTGTLILTSGTLTATGGNGAEVDGDWEGADVTADAGGNAINGNVTVSGGTLTAKGGNGGSVGDYSRYAKGAVGGIAISGSVTVTDGTVTATGGNGGSIGDAEGAHGGSGGAAIGGDATISGGTWTATDGTHGVNGNGQGGAGGKAVAGTVTDNR